MLSRSAFSYFKKFAFFSCSQFRNRNFQLLNHKSSIIQHNLCSTNAKEDKLISLDEINTFELSHLNCDKEKLSQIIHEILDRKREGKKIPRYVKQREFKDLIECESFNQRKKYLKYLFKKEMIKQNETEKKLQKKAELQSKIPKSLPETNHIQYGLGKNSMVLRTWKRSFLKFYDKRMANSVLFGQKIVIDLGYDKYMTNKERKGCASQVRLLYNSNKLSPDPFDLYFCNANPNSRCVQYLYELIPRLKESLVTQTEKSYLDFFPKEDLVYLSPHATETLKTYDHKAVYIIGNFINCLSKLFCYVLIVETAYHSFLEKMNANFQ